MKINNKITSPNDTICAISTPFGSGAISIIRLSGNNAISIFKKVFTPNKKTVDIDLLLTRRAEQLNVQEFVILTANVITDVTQKSEGLKLL